MKKLLLILLCVPMIGFGQNISFSELIQIKDVKTFEKIMYEKGMRYIESNKNYSYWPFTLSGDTMHMQTKKRGKTEFKSSDEFYIKEKELNSKFGMNYNSKTKSASLFCEIIEKSKYEAHPDMEKRNRNFNFVKYNLQFSEKANFNAFWNSININIIYSHTKNNGKRIYNYNNIEIEVKEYDDEIITISIVQNL
tara:strand:+ start:1818 stop:2399 length:582 start_codon:yes stop_codon:yes gene_type:complete